MPECTTATLDAPVRAIATGVQEPAQERRSLGTLAVLSALMAFGPLSTDFYLPALPTMAESLHSSHGVMEWTISSYLIGCSLAQLIWGPLSDRYGRRGPVATGIAIFIFGSAGCALSTSVGAMIAWRMVQASALARASRCRAPWCATSIPGPRRRR